MRMQSVYVNARVYLSLLPVSGFMFDFSKITFIHAVCAMRSLFTQIILSIYHTLYHFPIYQSL